jgi:hypothetical protein
MQSRTSWQVSTPQTEPALAVKVAKARSKMAERAEFKLQIIFNVAPKLPASKEQDFLKKKAYGKIPGYLTKIKNEI